MSVACTVAVTAGVTLVMSVPAGADPNDGGSCPAGAVFAVGGTWDPTGQTTQPVTDRYVAQGYASKPVTYPASFWPLGEQTYDQSVAAGAQTLRTEVNAFHAQCPGSEIVVTGYSQGARMPATCSVTSHATDPFRSRKSKRPLRRPSQLGRGHRNRSAQCRSGSDDVRSTRRIRRHRSAGSLHRG